MITAARLHGSKDVRVDKIDAPAPPGVGEVSLRVDAVGICGSDLHTYADARIGDTGVPSPFVLGHEFMGTVEALGEAAVDGHNQELHVGQRVAVDPAVPDESHEQYEKGNPNLVPAAFYGLYPDQGALRERMLVRARNCFPLPDTVSNAAGTMLETLGVAIHAVDLGHVKLADTVAVIGCGPVGMLIVRAAQLAGATSVYACDLHAWRADKARAWGATETWVHHDRATSVARIEALTNGRGADVVFEAAWSDDSVAMAADMARLGGRLVLVGIPGDDAFSLQHSTARRKGLTLMFSRRMKHTYPRALALATGGAIDLDDLVSHHFPLTEAPAAFQLNASYQDGVMKVIIDVAQRAG